MNQQEKSQVIESLKAGFNQHEAAFLIKVQGLTVDQMQFLRKRIRPFGSIVVAKNTLLSIAAQQVSGAEQLEPYFKEQIALVFVAKEAPSTAKILCTYAQENEKLNIVVGYLDKQLLAKDKVVYLGSLPSKEVLLAQLCGLLKSPLTRLAWLLTERAKQQNNQ